MLLSIEYMNKSLKYRHSSLLKITQNIVHSSFYLFEHTQCNTRQYNSGTNTQYLYQHLLLLLPRESMIIKKKKTVNLRGEKTRAGNGKSYLITLKILVH